MRFRVIAPNWMRLTALAALAGSGCNTPGKAEGPDLVVFQIKRRWVTDGTVSGPPKFCECYAALASTSKDVEEFTPLVAAAGRPACDGMAEDSCGEALGTDDLQAGWDSLYVVVDYQPLVLDFSAELAAPTVTVQIQGAPKDVPATISRPTLAAPGCSEESADPEDEPSTPCERRKWPYSHGEIVLRADLPEGSLVIHAGSHADYFSDLDVTYVEAPKAVLYFDPAKPTAAVAEQTRVDAVALVPSTWQGAPAVTVEERVDRYHIARAALTTAVPVASAMELRRSLLAPAGDEWEVVLSSGATTEGFNLTLTDLTFDLGLSRCDADSTSCEDPTCNLVGGVDRPDITITLPGSAEPGEAVVSVRAGDLPASEATITLARVAGEKRGTRNIEVPVAPGKLLQIKARVGQSERSICANIVPAGDILLALAPRDAEPDFGQPAELMRVSSESDSACRALTLHIQAPELPPDAIVKLSAAPGAAFGQQDTAEVLLSTGKVGVTLGHEDPAIEQLWFSAVAGAATGELRVELQPLYVDPVDLGSLSAAPKNQVVDAGGIKAIHLGGFVYPPDEGNRFVPGTRVYLRATATDGPDAIACGTALTTMEIDCDPFAPPGGGCVLAPRWLEVGAEGDFSYTIAGGHCLSGSVMFEVLGRTYESEAMCVGEQEVGAADKKLAEVVLNFQ